MPHHKVIVVDDSETIRTSVSAFLRGAGFDVAEGSTCAGALELCLSGQSDAAVVDYVLPDGTALDLLSRLKEAGNTVPVVVLTGHGSIDLAVRTIKEGAEHFLTTPVELNALAVVLRRVIEGRRALRKELAVRTAEGRKHPDPFLGQSKAIRKLEEEARLVIGSDSGVLIHCETGSGKAVLARWLCESSQRA